MTKSTYDRLREIITGGCYDLPKAMGVTQRLGEPVPFDESTLLSALPCDSLDHLELSMGMEDEFEIDILDDQVKEFTGMTIGQIAAWIDTQMEANDG